MNWKTTLFGTIFAGSSAIASSGSGKLQGIAALIAAFSGTLAAFFTKDKNVTGGTTPQQ